MFTLYLQTAATHTNNADKNFVILIWMSPPVGTGAIRFRCYIIIQLRLDLKIDFELGIIIKEKSRSCIAKYIPTAVTHQPASYIASSTQLQLGTYGVYMICQLASLNLIATPILHNDYGIHNVLNQCVPACNGASLDSCNCFHL